MNDRKRVREGVREAGREREGEIEERETGSYVTPISGGEVEP